MLILKSILKIIKIIVVVVYKLLKALHLRFVFLIAIAGLILYWTGAFNTNEVTVIYLIVAVFSVLLSFYLNGRNKLSKNKNKNVKIKSKNIEEVNQENEEESVQEVEPEKNTEEEKNEPIFYNVKGKSGYVMAEYKDRYELYKKVKGGLEKVREDKKEK